MDHVIYDSVVGKNRVMDPQLYNLLGIIHHGELMTSFCQSEARFSCATNKYLIFVLLENRAFL